MTSIEYDYPPPPPIKIHGYNTLPVHSGWKPVILFTVDDAPKLKDLMELKSKSGKKIRVVHGAASQWKELASVLGFQQDDIDSISRTYSKTHKACRHMLALWLKGDKGPWPVTWTSLIHGLISAGLVELADDLNESIDIHLPLSIEESRGMCI